jgi:rhodanese-related sulfurtransferase
MRTSARVGIIILVGSLLGLAWNAWSGRGFDLRASAFMEPGDQEVTAAEARGRLDKGALFLDARPVDFYELGHIPGALPLPENKFDEYFAKLEAQLRSSLDIIVYCSGFGCEASHMVARKLKEKGVPAAILHEGWPAWTDAGYPTKEGMEP